MLFNYSTHNTGTNIIEMARYLRLFADQWRSPQKLDIVFDTLLHANSFRSDAFILVQKPPCFSQKRSLGNEFKQRQDALDSLFDFPEIHPVDDTLVIIIGCCSLLQEGPEILVVEVGEAAICVDTHNNISVANRASMPFFLQRKWGY